MTGERIGILVGGGDCPGLNAVLRAVVRRAAQAGAEVIGLENGWRGLVEDDSHPLTRWSVAGIQPRGGVILGTSRFNPLESVEMVREIQRTWDRHALTALIVVGGNGTLSCAASMWADHNFPIIGVPATIDNDIPRTDYTLGFQTAVSVATDALDRLHTTAEARRHVVVAEVMGGNSGWIATCAGLAASADAILIPERPFRMTSVCELVRERALTGRPYSLIVTAESAKPHREENFLPAEQGGGARRARRPEGIGELVAGRIEEMTGVFTRVSVLGPVLMGGPPVAYDRMLGTRFGLHAAEMALRGMWGQMVALLGTNVFSVPLSEVADKAKPVDEALYRDAEVFFG